MSPPLHVRTVSLHLYTSPKKICMNQLIHLLYYMFNTQNKSIFIFKNDIINFHLINIKEPTMKLISWNVNGLRAAVRKGFLDFFETINADIFAVQEIKLQAGQIDLDLPGYEAYWNYAERKGYAGTAIFTKHTPLSVQYGLNEDDVESEGRIITLEFDQFYFVTVYSPNSQRTLVRLDA